MFKRRKREKSINVVSVSRPHIIYKDMDCNRSTDNPTTALYWIKAGYRVIPIQE